MRTLVVTLSPPVDALAARTVLDRARALLPAVDVMQVHIEGTVDLSAVDVVLRLVVLGRRCSVGLTVRADGFDELLGLCGLGSLQPLGQPEPREQCGVQEMVQVLHTPVRQLEHLDAPRLPPACG